MRTIDFIDNNYEAISPRLRKILFTVSERYHYIEQINRSVLKKYRGCGSGTILEFENLFSENSKPLEVLFEIEKEQLQTPNHYDNSKGSLYQFCENQNLNSYEFEVIKRVVRCRKKGEFISDIEKTIKVLQIYLQEQGEKYIGQIEKLNEYEK